MGRRNNGLIRRDNQRLDLQRELEITSQNRAWNLDISVFGLVTIVHYADKAVLWLWYLEVYVQEDLAQLEAVAGQTHQGCVSAW